MTTGVIVRGCRYVRVFIRKGSERVKKGLIMHVRDCVK